MEKTTLSVTTKSPTVQACITTAALSLIESYLLEVKEISLPAHKKDKLAALRQVGLTASATCQSLMKEEEAVDTHNDRVRKIREGVYFLGECFRKFGKQARLITYDDFYAIVEKYELATAPLSSYTGHIPDGNLKEITRCKKVLDGIYRESLIGRHMDTAVIRGGEMLPASSRGRYWGEGYKMFIAAPSDEIDNSKADPHADERYKTRDPLVCSYTDIGVLIYSAWGDEADDTIFEKYKALNKAIQNISGNRLLRACRIEMAEYGIVGFICMLIMYLVLLAGVGSICVVWPAWGLYVSCVRHEWDGVVAWCLFLVFEAFMLWWAVCKVKGDSEEH